MDTRSGTARAGPCLRTGDDDIVLLRADSAAWALPPRADHRLSHVTGQWAAETQLRRQTLPFGRAGFTGGAGHDSTTLRLAPGETHTTPRFAGLHTRGGFGAASRAWHAYTRTHVLPHPDETRPVLHNSWEATGFDIDEGRQMALAARAAALGAELYVMDDGWFGARRGDRAGLGGRQRHRLPQVGHEPAVQPDGSVRARR
ncbi:alpha-galactosidase [Streptomyces sp. NPDC102441]|uniref:alpha-galactosidase n=1 Tax=Streptomyces sp. NPDC102441 TaxID=3366176 RepID=UPI0037FEFFF0